jgi:threonine dehydrogenase-like Zn-dependent dehydrogenase
MAATRAQAPPATMRAGVITGPRDVRLAATPVPAPAAGEVLVRIEGCGVCGSDVPVWEGRPWFAYPLEPGAPGHEGWGLVEASGDGVDKPAPGERVALICERAFAEYAVAPAAHCVPIDGSRFPGEPAACAVNVVRRSDIRSGQRVAIVGVGFLGSLVQQLCERAGAEVVPVRRDSNVSGEFERVVEAAGTQEALDRASALVAERGRLVIAGYHQDGPRTVDLQSWNWRGIDVVNAHERDPLVYVDAMREAVAAGVDIESLLTHRFPLARLGEAFDAARTRPPGFVKAWVEP